jgi:hypothetical protein
MFSYHFKKIDQILILCCNLEEESLNYPKKVVQFFIYLKQMGYNGTYEPICYFSAIFHILLDAHVVQYGINFDNSVEIQLTYKK